MTKITALGYFDEVPNYRLSEEANPDRCRRCYSAIWVMLSRAGFEIKLDTKRLSLEDEIQAVLAKRRTFEATRQGKSFVVDRRDIIRIKGEQSRPVLAVHECKALPETEWPEYWPNSKYTETEGIPF